MKARLRAIGTMAGRQGGAATIAIAFVILFLLGIALIAALGMSGSVVRDSALGEKQVEALFLAESGLERVAQRLSSTACASLGTEGPFTLGDGTFSVISPAPYLDTGLCRVRVSGTAGSTTRTVDAWLSSGGGSGITTDNTAASTSVGSGTTRTLSYTVPAGASILLVGVSFNDSSATASVKYNGIDLTQGTALSVPPSWPKSQIWYLVNPPSGTYNVVASFSANVEAVLGARWFAGVNTSTATPPWDVAAVNNDGNGKATTITVTPATGNAWIFEVAAMVANDVTSMGALTNRTSRWNTNSNGNARGAASTIGPVSTAQTPVWSWSTGNNAKWTQVAVVLQANGGSVSVRKWSEVVN